jgi:hypothetical protein
MKKIENPKEIQIKPKPTNWNFKDLEGRRFGHLYVAGYLGKRLINDPSFWLLHCDCGNFIKVETVRLTSGRVTHCGCMKKLRKESARNEEAEIA